GRQLLVWRPRSVGNGGGCGASFLLGLYLAGALRRGPGHPQFLHEDRRSHNRGSVRPYFLERLTAPVTRRCISRGTVWPTATPARGRTRPSLPRSAPSLAAATGARARARR